MPATQAVKAQQYTGVRLFPKTGRGRQQQVVLQPSTVFTSGQILGQAGAAVNDVQTLTIGGTPTGGTFPLNGVNPVSGAPFTITVNYSSTTVQTQALLDAALGALGSTTRLITVSGGTLPGSTQIFTGSNAAAGMPIQLMTGAITGLTGGAPTFAVVHTTVGAVVNAYGPYASAPVAAPTTAPTVAAAGADGTLAVGAYAVYYTFLTALGETTPSPEATIAVASTNHIAVTSITGIAAGVVSVNVYLDGDLAVNQAVTAGATGNFNITAPGAAGQNAPVTNTAYTGTIPVAACIMEWNAATDANGNITLGATAVAQVGNQWGQTYQSIEAYFGDGQSIYDTTKLTGLDAKAMSDMKAVLETGTIAAGIIRF